MDWFLFWLGFGLITFHCVATLEPRPSGTPQWVASVCIAVLWPAFWLAVLVEFVIGGKR